MASVARDAEGHKQNRTGREHVREPGPVAGECADQRDRGDRRGRRRHRRDRLRQRLHRGEDFAAQAVVLSEWLLGHALPFQAFDICVGCDEFSGQRYRRRLASARTDAAIEDLFSDGQEMEIWIEPDRVCVNNRVPSILQLPKVH